MSEYNSAFDFNAIDGAYDMPGSLDAEPTPTMDQSGNGNAAVHPQSELMEGGTAAPLHARLDFAPLEGAKSNRSTRNDLIRRGDSVIGCAICLSTFQTVSALDNHAKEANHQAYKCKCGTGFNKHSALQRHINTKDAPKTFACTLCSDKFTRKDKLKDHCRHYHKVTDDRLRFLFDSQQVKARPGAATRRRRAPVPLAAASSASAATPAPAPPALASASAGLSLWSPSAYTGQQYTRFSTGSFGPTDQLVTTNSFGSSGAFVPAADSFATAPVHGEDVSGTFDNFLGDETWATGFDGFNF